MIQLSKPRHDKISFIIPTFNYARYLPKCIQSIIDQDLENYEIIIIDDGSTDETRHVVNKIDGNIKYIYQENSGLSAARNTGIQESDGQYIQFIDADDVLGKNIVKNQLMNIHSKKHCHISVCRNLTFSNVNSNGDPIPNGTWRLFRNNLDIHLCYFNIAPPISFLVTRTLVNQVGLFDTTLAAAEDYDYWFRALMLNHIPSFNPNGVVYYRKHKNSLSNNLIRQHKHDALLHDRIYDFLKNDTRFPINRRVDGLLAFSAGALLTSCRLKCHGIYEQLSTIDFAIDMLKTAISEFSKDKNFSITTLLYYLRILTTVNQYAKSLENEYFTINTLLTNLKLAMLEHHKSSNINRIYLMILLRKNSDDIVEKWRTLTLLYQLMQTKVELH